MAHHDCPGGVEPGFGEVIVAVKGNGGTVDHQKAW